MFWGNAPRHPRHNNPTTGVDFPLCTCVVALCSVLCCASSLHEVLSLAFKGPRSLAATQPRSLPHAPRSHQTLLGPATTRRYPPSQTCVAHPGVASTWWHRRRWGCAEQEERASYVDWLGLGSRPPCVPREPAEARGSARRASCSGIELILTRFPCGTRRGKAAFGRQPPCRHRWEAPSRASP